MIRKGKSLSILKPEYIEKMVAIYEECQRVSEQTGIPHEVDHIIPLKGKDVSGLHVPWNLQIITAEENRSKNNSFKVGG